MKNLSSRLLAAGWWLLLQIACFITVAQQPLPGNQQPFTGKVTGKNGEPLAGATVRIKGSKTTTQTDAGGQFHFSDVPAGGFVLLVSHVGYETAEVKATAGTIAVDIPLKVREESGDEVVVTGVFDRRKKLEASIAITTLSSQLIEKQVPVSAADLLKNVPGVFVNSSLGEIRNSVASRGITIGTQDGSFGYEYVSMQEDGLPITNTTYFSYGPDFFLRPDATLGRLEAVRGGPASITAANAPGGIFNYISKTGGDAFAGEIRAKYGMQGRDNKGFYRIDAQLGGPLGKNWFYSLGGFYRYDEGGRYAGYPMNRGGQVKANLTKKYAKGSIKLFLKSLQDHNGFVNVTPTVDFSDPKPAPGFDISSSVLAPAFDYYSPDFLNLYGGQLHLNPKNLVKIRYNSAQLNWEHNFGNGWSISNAGRFADNKVLYNTTSFATANGNELTPYYLLGGMNALGYGTYSYKDAQTGQELLNVAAAPGAGGLPAYTITTNQLPNQQLGEGRYIISPTGFYNNEVTEFLDQFAITKKLRSMSFTAGAYFGHSDVHRYSGIDGVALMTLQDRPRLMTLSFNGATLGGTVGEHFFTNPIGIGQANGDNGTFLSFNAKQQQLALFFGHNWQLTDQLTVDWGLRYETVNVRGYNDRVYFMSGVQGGVDGNPLTLYDNNTVDHVSNVTFNKTLQSLSYSAALNYKFNERMAVYGRYSRGRKAPDLDVYFAANRPETIGLLNAQQRTTEQVEVGLKARTGNLNLFVTPFYSILSGVPQGAMFQNATPPGGLYSPPALYSKYRTVGVEIEADYKIIEVLSVRAIATFQKSTIVENEVWVANAPGPADDTKISYSGNETDNNARSIIRVVPTFTRGKFYADITWSYLGKRQANAANVFTLPAFSQFDAGAGYRFTRALQLSFNVNNVFNTYGAMSWIRPGGIIETLEGNNAFDKARYDAAVAANLPFGTISIPPRAGFLTLSFKF